MNECEYIDDCKNINSPKCDLCENNPANFEKIAADDLKESVYKPAGRKFYIYANHYEPQ